MDALDWAKRVQDLGAGEIIVTSIDKEGTGEGFEIDLYFKLKKFIKIPIIAHGGANDSNSISELFKKTDVNAACLASTLHYNLIQRLNLHTDFEKEGNLNFINREKKKFKNFGNESIDEIKTNLKKQKFNIRI